MLTNIFKLLSFIGILSGYIPRIINKFLLVVNIGRFKRCGTNVKFNPLSSSFVYKNISIGNDVYIGEKASFMPYIAHLYIGNKVMFGPNVTIRGGMHPYYVSGRFLFDIGENENNPDDDQDIYIEDDVWVGTNVTILKGVVVGRGSVVAAGAVVTKSVAPYTIVGGVPAKKLSNRFNTLEKTLFHDHTLFQNNIISEVEIKNQFKI